MKPMFWMHEGEMLTAQVDDDVLPLQLGGRCETCLPEARDVVSIDGVLGSYRCAGGADGALGSREHTLPARTCEASGRFLTICDAKTGAPMRTITGTVKEGG